jgi:hypothetical protein
MVTRTASRLFPGDQTQAQLDLAFGVGVAAACAPAATAGSLRRTTAASTARGMPVVPVPVSLTDETFGLLAARPPGQPGDRADFAADVNYRPRNADGGLIGIESGINAAGAAAPFIAGMRGSFFICSDGILGRYVRQIDTARWMTATPPAVRCRRCRPAATWCRGDGHGGHRRRHAIHGLRVLLSVLSGPRAGPVRRNG